MLLIDTYIWWLDMGNSLVIAEQERCHGEFSLAHEIELQPTQQCRVLAFQDSEGKMNLFVNFSVWPEGWAGRWRHLEMSGCS